MRMGFVASTLRGVWRESRSEWRRLVGQASPRNVCENLPAADAVG